MTGVDGMVFAAMLPGILQASSRGRRLYLAIISAFMVYNLMA